MPAKHTDVIKLIFFLAAVLLLAVPIQAQTLQASSTQVTIGQVIGCNDTQVVNLTSSGSQIKLTVAIVYKSGDLHDGWLFVRDTSTGNTTNGSSTLNMTIPASTSIGLEIGLNNQIAASDTATVTLTTTTPAGQTVSITANMSNTLACSPLTAGNGSLIVVPALLSLTAAQGQATTGNVMVTNISANPVTFTALTDAFNNSWLSLGLGTVTLAPGQSIALPVTAFAGSLPLGTYSTWFLLSVGPTNVGSISIPVTFTVTSNGVGPTITTGVQVSPTALNFNYVPGGAPLGLKAVQVTNQVGTAPIPFTISVTQYNGPAGWLTTNFTPGAQTPFSLAVTVNGAGTTPGITYQGTITITPYLGPAVQIYVSLAVTPPPVVTAMPTSLTFNYTQGGATPLSQAVLVTGGGSIVDYSTVAPIPSWLSANPPSGVAPYDVPPFDLPPAGGAYLAVSVNPAGLPVGTYTGTLTVYGSGPAVGNTNITVTLIVSGPAVKGVSNSASFAGGPVAPGEMVTLFADPTSAFGPAQGVPLSSDQIVNSRLPTVLGGVQVYFNGIAAPLIFVSATQINTVVPYEVAGTSNLTVSVVYNGLTTAPFALRLADAQPALFTATATGVGQGAVGQYDARGNYLGMNSASNPVVRGNVVTLYVTGEGKTQNAVTGLITAAQATAPYTPQPMLTPSVLIDGQPATVTFFGEVPGVVAGMMQVNVIVPNSARSGMSIPVSITLGTSYSQAGVTIAAQ